MLIPFIKDAFQNKCKNDRAARKVKLDNLSEKEKTSQGTEEGKEKLKQARERKKQKRRQKSDEQREKLKELKEEGKIMFEDKHKNVRVLFFAFILTCFLPPDPNNYYVRGW